MLARLVVCVGSCTGDTGLGFDLGDAFAEAFVGEAFMGEVVQDGG